ncbi:MAG: GerMN domain-containing protein [Patescibacteria group bacterium]
MKKLVILILIAVIVFGIYFILKDNSEEVSLFFVKAGSEEVVAVQIQVDKENAEKNTLVELLKGPAEPEKYFSVIPKGVKIQSFKIENKTAEVDFSEELERGIAGSMQVLVIREQIEKTLKQFDSISEVIIGINGRTEDILQP